MKENSINILLIEDDPDFARLASNVLASSTDPKIEFDHSETLQIGLDLLGKNQYDLILLDLNLPDSSNINTVAKACDNTEIPIIILTATDDESTAIQAMQMGAQDFILKSSLDRALLLRSIQYAIERKKFEVNLRETKEYFRLLIENALDLIAVLETDSTINYVSPSHKRILGYDDDELIGKRGFDFIHPDDFESVQRTLNDGLNEPHLVHTVEYRFKHKDGRWVTLESIGKMFSPETGEAKIVVNSRDITERKKMEETLRNLSITDDLTGLYNRRGFLTLAEHLIKTAERASQDIFLILIDLDDLKKINDEFGHKEGDQALMDIAYIIKQTFRGSDVIARISGDEFVILASDTSGNIIEAITDRLATNLEIFNLNKKRPYKLGISYGVARYSESDANSLDRLLVIADELMYRHKNSKNSSRANAARDIS